MIEFEVKGKIRGKQRPRFANGVVYTPKETRDYEKHIVLSYLGQGGKHFGEKKIGLQIVIYHEPPKSWSKKKRSEAIGCDAVRRADVDNVAKIVMDALENVAYKNDMQVTSLDVLRVYGAEEKLFVKIEAYD